jgi:hypothetical protein
MPETITYEEIGRLLGLAAARDQRTVGDADGLAWHEDLNAACINYDDAQAALAAFYQEMANRRPADRFRATPIDIIDNARRLRRERLASFVYEPGDGDDDPQQYLANLRQQIAATANGQRPANPDAVPQLEGGPHPTVLAAIEGAVRTVPDDKPARKPGPLGIECPTCKARIGRHCQWPGGTRRPTHGARKRAANGEPPAPADDTAERRAASAAALQQLTPQQHEQLDHIHQQHTQEH